MAPTHSKPTFQAAPLCGPINSPPRYTSTNTILLHCEMSSISEQLMVLFFGKQNNPNIQPFCKTFFDLYQKNPALFFQKVGILCDVILRDDNTADGMKLGNPGANNLKYYAFLVKLPPSSDPLAMRNTIVDLATNIFNTIAIKPYNPSTPDTTFRYSTKVVKGQDYTRDGPRALGAIIAKEASHSYLQTRYPAIDSMELSRDIAIMTDMYGTMEYAALSFPTFNPPNDEAPVADDVFAAIPDLDFNAAPTNNADFLPNLPPCAANNNPSPSIAAAANNNDRDPLVNNDDADTSSIENSNHDDDHDDTTSAAEPSAPEAPEADEAQDPPIPKKNPKRRKTQH